MPGSLKSDPGTVGDLEHHPKHMSGSKEGQGALTVPERNEELLASIAPCKAEGRWAAAHTCFCGIRLSHWAGRSRQCPGKDSTEGQVMSPLQLKPRSCMASLPSAWHSGTLFPVRNPCCIQGFPTLASFSPFLAESGSCPGIPEAYDPWHLRVSHCPAPFSTLPGKVTAASSVGHEGWGQPESRTLIPRPLTPAPLAH